MTPINSKNNTVSINQDNETQNQQVNQNPFLASVNMPASIQQTTEAIDEISRTVQDRGASRRFRALTSITNVGSASAIVATVGLTPLNGLMLASSTISAVILSTPRPGTTWSDRIRVISAICQGDGSRVHDAVDGRRTANIQGRDGSNSGFLGRFRNSVYGFFGRSQQTDSSHSESLPTVSLSVDSSGRHRRMPESAYEDTVDGVLSTSSVLNQNNGQNISGQRGFSVDDILSSVETDNVNGIQGAGLNPMQYSTNTLEFILQNRALIVGGLCSLMSLGIASHLLSASLISVHNSNVCNANYTNVPPTFSPTMSAQDILNARFSAEVANVAGSFLSLIYFVRRFGHRGALALVQQAERVLATRLDEQRNNIRSLQESISSLQTVSAQEPVRVASGRRLDKLGLINQGYMADSEDEIPSSPAMEINRTQVCSICKMTEDKSKDEAIFNTDNRSESEYEWSDCINDPRDLVQTSQSIRSDHHINIESHHCSREEYILNDQNTINRPGTPMFQITNLLQEDNKFEDVYSSDNESDKTSVCTLRDHPGDYEEVEILI